MADSAKSTTVTVDFTVKGLSDLESANTALDAIEKSAEGAGGGLEKASTELDKASESSKETSESFVELAAKSELVGQMQEAIGSVTDALAECVDAAAEFETVIAKVATIADTTETSIDEISDSILELSNETGVAATSLSDSVYSAISASVDTADAVDFVAQANALAVGGFTDAETAVDVLTTAINAYGLEASDAATISDYLITTQSLGKTTVDELANSMGRVIPLVSAYNVDMANLSSSYAILTKNGIATNEATTYLTAILNELGDSGSTVSAILQEQTGMSFSELSEAGYSLGDVMGILGDSVDNDATAFSNLWSQQTAGVGALSLLNSGTAEYNSTLSEMTSSTGVADAAYETMADTAEYAQQKLTTSAENLKTAIS
ncbi:MAG: phage tail tape measure protein, partial [Ruminococcus sp.]|nr:phage tail tape measure protein [Ruminococcus sp.]